MGESRRRKAALGDDYGKAEPFLPGLPITKAQSEQFMTLTARATWIGIILLLGAWLTIRFIGPAAGWWTVV